MMNKTEKYNLMMDFYEVALANGFMKQGMTDTVAWFDMFFRPSAEMGGFCIMSGIKQLADYITNLS